MEYEDVHWGWWLAFVISAIIFVFLVAIGDRGHEFNDRTPVTVVPAAGYSYPLGVEDESR